MRSRSVRPSLFLPRDLTEAFRFNSREKTLVAGVRCGAVEGWIIESHLGASIATLGDSCLAGAANLTPRLSQQFD